MRVDDEYCHGSELRGLYQYHHGGTKLDVVLDFFKFCKLAVRRKAIPSGWNWSEFLNIAKKLIPYAFEKSDAKEKYGGENYFSVIMGGRSLRATGEIICASTVTNLDNNSNLEESQALDEVVSIMISGSGKNLFFDYEEEFKDVGGGKEWHSFFLTLKL